MSQPCRAGANAGTNLVAGRVRITAGEGFTSLLLQVASRLRDEHPRLELDLALDHHVYDLVRGQADLAVRTVRPRESSLAARKLAQLQFGLFASERYLDRYGAPRSVAEIKRHAVIGLSESMASASEMQWLIARGVDRFVVRANSSLTLLDAVSAGLGIAPLAVALAATRPGLVHVLPNTRLPTVTMWLVFRAADRKSRQIRAVVDAICEELARVGSVTAPRAGSGYA